MKFKQTPVKTDLGSNRRKEYKKMISKKQFCIYYSIYSLLFELVLYYDIPFIRENKLDSIFSFIGGCSRISLLYIILIFFIFKFNSLTFGKEKINTLNIRIKDKRTLMLVVLIFLINYIGILFSIMFYVLIGTFFCAFSIIVGFILNKKKFCKILSIHGYYGLISISLLQLSAFFLIFFLS